MTLVTDIGDGWQHLPNGVQRGERIFLDCVIVILLLCGGVGREGGNGILWVMGILGIITFARYSLHGYRQ